LSKFASKLGNAECKIKSIGGITIENSLPMLLGKAASDEMLFVSFLKYIDK